MCLGDAIRFRVFVVTFVLLLIPSRATGMAGGVNGDDWLQLTEDQRHSYIYGYFHGYEEAYFLGCQTAARIAQADPSVNLMGRCMDQRLNYLRPLEHYVEQITLFYRKYPEDRKLRVLHLLKKLSKQKNKSLEEIHQMVRNGKLL